MPLLKYADPGSRLTCCDLSPQMLRRARQRLKSYNPDHVAADLAHLPFADESFDCVTCGYVLEHLPDARTGLAELARVMTRGGRMLLLTTEDSFSGAFTSRFWCCRTYNRADLFRTCQEVGLRWRQELWFTRMHKLLRRRHLRRDRAGLTPPRGQFESRDPLRMIAVKFSRFAGTGRHVAWRCQ